VQDVWEREEQMHEFKFCAGRIPQSLLSAWQAACGAPDMFMPPRNPFMSCADMNSCYSEEESTLEGDSGSTGSATSSEADGVHCFSEGKHYFYEGEHYFYEGRLHLRYKPNSEFHAPRAYAFFSILSPVLSQSAKGRARSSLFIDCVKSSLQEALSQAEAAGFTAEISQDGEFGEFTTIEVNMTGFVDTLPMLAEVVFQV
jgi:secreted Zn-dependent insulinase-like peptidase